VKAAACACAVAVIGAGAAQRPVPPGAMSRAEARRLAADLGALGRALFFDPALSASGRQACASCHSPDHAFGPPDEAAVRKGGPDLQRSGLRAVPSLMYLQSVPAFSEHFFDSDDEADGSVDNGPTGGLTWDGRVDRGAAQALDPLLSPFEMANGDEAALAARVRRAGYADRLGRILGPGAVATATATAASVGKALEVFEQDYRTFYPYSSKYDAWLAGEATLSPAEARGLRLFEARDKGNCAACHVSRRGKDGTPPQFTDYGFIALGVPRNPAIPANADPAYFDLGLCGPLRPDFRGRAEYCGRFRTPTLRNVATRRVFFHNGVIHSLHDAVAFYARRDTNPDEWYPRGADGRPRVFDDLPSRYRANVNREPPFGRAPGEAPALTLADIDDVVAFLQTLSDGYRAGPN
jgi:cytochrome c peroxidase